MSPASFYISLEYRSCFAPGIYILKMQRMVIALGGRYAQVPAYLLQAASHPKVLCGLMKDCIAGTKCSDMSEMSKCYYGPLKGPPFRDKNGNFYALAVGINHKYHFKPCP